MRVQASALFALVILAGCGGGGGIAPVPSSDEARKSLQITLDAWKAGKPASSLEEGAPKIEAVDFDWKAGKTMTDYVIGDESPGEGTKTFGVTLTLAPGGTKDVKFMVLGKEPVRVYRDEDFQRMLNMEDDPAALKVKTKRR
ncbi:MAG: hypothetical protein JWN86_4645 [Planctomycetota bacterium]|nr:hypothetical protein [Planctomycetota bacterium]